MGAVPPEVTPAQAFVSRTRRHQLMGLLPGWAPPESIRGTEWTHSFSLVAQAPPRRVTSPRPRQFSVFLSLSSSVLSSLLCFPWTRLPAQGLVWGY